MCFYRSWCYTVWIDSLNIRRTRVTRLPQPCTIVATSILFAIVRNLVLPYLFVFYSTLNVVFGVDLCESLNAVIDTFIVNWTDIQKKKKQMYKLY